MGQATLIQRATGRKSHEHFLEDAAYTLEPNDMEGQLAGAMATARGQLIVHAAMTAIQPILTSQSEAERDVYTSLPIRWTHPDE